MISVIHLGNVLIFFLFFFFLFLPGKKASRATAALYIVPVAVLDIPATVLIMLEETGFAHASWTWLASGMLIAATLLYQVFFLVIFSIRKRKTSRESQ